MSPDHVRVGDKVFLRPGSSNWVWTVTEYLPNWDPDLVHLVDQCNCSRYVSPRSIERA